MLAACHNMKFDRHCSPHVRQDESTSGDSGDVEMAAEGLLVVLVGFRPRPAADVARQCLRSVCDLDTATVARAHRQRGDLFHLLTISSATCDSRVTNYHSRGTSPIHLAPTHPVRSSRRGATRSRPVEPIRNFTSSGDATSPPWRRRRPRRLHTDLDAPSTTSNTGFSPASWPWSAGRAPGRAPVAVHHDGHVPGTRSFGIAGGPGTGRVRRRRTDRSAAHAHSVGGDCP